MHTEWTELESAGTWQWCPIDEPRSIKSQVIRSKWVFRYKEDRMKSRITARGDTQAKHEIGNTYAPVIRPETERIMYALSARNRWSVRGFDVRNAYVQSHLPRPVYMYPPDGYSRPGYCLKLNKALYGLGSSGRLWYKKFRNDLRTIGYKPSPVDPCLYVHRSRQCFIATHVDDCIAFGTEEYVSATIAAVKSIYSIRDLGDRPWESLGPTNT